MEILILIGIAIFIWSIINHFRDRAAETSRRRHQLSHAQSEITALQKRLKENHIVQELEEERVESERIGLKAEIADLKSALARREKACALTCARKDREVKRILAEASCGLPWLAKALAHYETLNDLRLARHLETKPHPAVIAAQHVRNARQHSRVHRAEYHIARARLEYYESLFPWLEEYIGIDLDELLRFAREDTAGHEEGDPVRRYLPQGQYDTLSPAERNQLALDRYLSGNRSPWQVGRDYERYIGYLFEKDGYNVQYTGIFEGVADRGRDIIATKGNQIRVVQCKCWAAHKTIKENHIAQHYGTTIKFRYENGLPVDTPIQAVFVTSTALSEVAKEFANQLGIIVREHVPYDKMYPMIKCNLGRDEFGFETRIYHLPMDQQYDTVKISRPGEKYVATVAEAEAMGFRRAYHWHPQADG